MKTAEIKDIRRNIMGTTSFDMKAAGMRKAQSFIVYPVARDTEEIKVRIQSENYWAEIDPETGEGELSARHSHANTWAFHLDKTRGKTKRFQLSQLDLQALKMQVFTSSNKEAGESVVRTDNSGAVNIFDL